jgi:hypothetical protein
MAQLDWATCRAVLPRHGRHSGNPGQAAATQRSATVNRCDRNLQIGRTSGRHWRDSLTLPASTYRRASSRPGPARRSMALGNIPNEWKLIGTIRAKVQISQPIVASLVRNSGTRCTGGSQFLQSASIRMQQHATLVPSLSLLRIEGPSPCVSG